MGAGHRRDITAYFALVGLLTLPVWIAGGLVQTRLLPGLSITAFAFVVPTISAAIAAGMAGGRDSVRSLFAFLHRPGHRVLLVGAGAVVVPSVAALASWDLAAPGERVFIEPLGLLALIPIFFAAATAEEIGWSAFATERLHHRLGAVATGLLIGVAWSLWHIPSLIELGHSGTWIAWWTVWTVAQRVTMVGLYVRGGSWIWAPILFHATSNIVWQAAPDAFDPRVEGLLMAAMSSAVSLLPWPRRIG